MSTYNDNAVPGVKPNYKTVEMFISLYPGWQDGSCGHLNAFQSPPSDFPMSPGWRLVKILVALPCFGGSAEVSETVRAQVVSQEVAK